MSEQQEEQQRDTGVWIRRILNVVISLVIGYVLTVASVWFILQTVMSDYGTVYIVCTVVSIACAVGIWLDHEKVLNSKILPH